MTMPTTGPISLAQVNSELGRTAGSTISLGEAATRALGATPTGPISLGALRGKTSGVGPGSVTFTPAPGVIDIYGNGLAAVTITCSAVATWTWTVAGAGAATIASGGIGTSNIFRLIATNIGRVSTFEVDVTAGGVTRHYKINLHAYSIGGWGRF